MNMIKSFENCERKTFMKKFSKKVPIQTGKIKGTFTIHNYRKYSCYEEVDVVFEGLIFCKLGRKPPQWYDKREIDLVKNISKVKLNRFLRKSIYDDVQRRCRIFSSEIRTYHDIKKITWLS